MATRIRHNSENLSAAMTLLIQTQAQFVAELAETRKEFAAMRQDLETIKAVLVRHEAALEKRTEAIKAKIGFKRH